MSKRRDPDYVMKAMLRGTKKPGMSINEQLARAAAASSLPTQEESDACDLAFDMRLMNLKGAPSCMRDDFRAGWFFAMALAALRAQPAPDGPAAGQAACSEGWIVVKEHSWDMEDGGRPVLAYLWPADFERKVYASFEEAAAFIKEGEGLPPGWVAMRIRLAAAPHPPAQRAQAEAVAWRNTRTGQLENAAAFARSELDYGDRSAWAPLYATPQQAAVQPQRGAGEGMVPLSNGEKQQMWRDATIEACSHENCYLRGIADAERHHGIRLAGSEGQPPT